MKVLKITGAILAILLLAVVTIPLLLVSRLEPIVLREANKQLDATLTFEKLDVSLLAHFPQASLSLQNLSVTGQAPFEGDTLVSAKEITLVVNLLSLSGNSGFEVSKVLLQSPKLSALAQKDGRVNWDILKKEATASQPTTTTAAPSKEEPAQATNTPETTPSSFRLLLKDVAVKDGQLSYQDEATQTQATITGLNWNVKGDMSAQQTLLETAVTAASITWIEKNQTLINRVKLEWNASLDANFSEKRFQLKENNLTINAMKAMVTGEVHQQDSNLAVNLALNSEKMEFKELLSLIPAFYTQDFEGLTASGTLEIDAWIKGNYTPHQLPAFEATVSVNNGNFKYANLPKSVEQIEVALAISNPGGALDDTAIDLSNLSLTMAGQKVNGSVKITHPVSDPYIATTLHGVVNLGAIKEVYPLPDSLSLNGVVTADLQLAAQLSAIEKEAYEKMAAQGTFTIQEMELTMKGLPTVAIHRAKATITPATMVLSEAQLQVGKSDLMLQGKLTNYLAYAVKNELLTGQLSMVSNRLDLNEWMNRSTPTTDRTTSPATKEESSSSQTISSPTTAETGATVNSALNFAIPTNLDLQLQSTIGEIAFQQLNLTNFKGELELKKGTLSMNNVSMNGLGGKMSASGQFSTAENPKQPQLVIKSSIQEASFEKTFKELQLIQQMAPLFAKTGGNYSLALNLTAALDSTLSPILKSVNGNGTIQSKSIQLQNLTLFTQLADALKDERLKKIEAKDVKIAFTIDEGKITTAPFDLHMGGINLNLAGTTNLDQHIAYKATISLPSNGQNYLQKIPVEIGGSFTAPTVTLGVEEMVGDAIKNVLQNEANKLLGGSLGNLPTTNLSKEERLKAAKTEGDKLIERAKKEGQALVDKANNPLLKMAAQKSADLLVQAAQKRAQQLIDEAEKEQK
ncbi:MAG: AsmA-like C-terminal region-containing protein [Phocaeicola sp.]